jgi:isoquinoline 1-oxidoreductase subunit alpha
LRYFIQISSTRHVGKRLQPKRCGGEVDKALEKQDGFEDDMLDLNVNDQNRTVDASPETPLLWVIRDTLGLAGTKFGCGMALCGACTVHLDGKPVRSCITPVSEAVGRIVTTIEGISSATIVEGRSTTVLHSVQQAWIDEQVPQCGYCQSGQIMSAVALLRAKQSPTDAEIDSAMAGNVCRCGMYGRIRKAIKRAAAGGVA